MAIADIGIYFQTNYGLIKKKKKKTYFNFRSISNRVPLRCVCVWIQFCVFFRKTTTPTTATKNLFLNLIVEPLSCWNAVYKHKAPVCVSYNIMEEWHSKWWTIIAHAIHIDLCMPFINMSFKWLFDNILVINHIHPITHHLALEYQFELILFAWIAIDFLLLRAVLTIDLLCSLNE